MTLSDHLLLYNGPHITCGILFILHNLILRTALFRKYLLSSQCPSGSTRETLGWKDIRETEEFAIWQGKHKTCPEKKLITNAKQMGQYGIAWAV